MSDLISLEFKKLSNEDLVHRSYDYYQKLDKRRTTRELSDEEIPLEVLENLILSAGTSPSGANLQPWTFALVRNKELKKEIRKQAEEVEKKSYEEQFSKEKLDDLKFTGLNWEKPFLENAPALIVVFKHKYRVDEEGNHHKIYYPNESIGIATGLLFSAIHNSGLCTIPYTPLPLTFIKRILKRPDNEAPFMILPIAFPKDDAKIPDKQRKSLNEIIVRYD